MSIRHRRAHRAYSIRRCRTSSYRVAASKGSKAMIKRMIIMLVLVGVVLAGVFGFKIFDDGQVKAFMASMGNLPQTVSTTKVARSDWQPKLQAVGSLKQHAGKSKREAIEIAAGIRLRPILMTTAAMVLGVIHS